MPPRIQTPLYVRAASPQCLLRPQCRSFKVSTVFLSQIPPESPEFIYIPQSAQPDAVYRWPIKGVLPKHRKIFPKNSDKTSVEYLTAVTPEPVKKSSSRRPSNPSVAARVDFKTRLAADRRRNLRESLVELQQRKALSEKRMNIQSRGKEAHRKALLSAPLPPDEQHTQPSTLSSSLPHRGSLPDPDRAARLEQKRRNVEAHLARKREARRDDLHVLYTNAQNFIVTEEALSKEVDRVFDNLEQFRVEMTPGLNIWNRGFPPTVKEMLQRSSIGEGNTAVERESGHEALTSERVKRVGEELTGGRM
ncbi:MAG: hypothetical protein Q9167_003872 [Letrouitia subvulpina]